MEKTELKDLLRDFFPKLEEASLNSLLPYCRYKEAKKGTRLIREGAKHPYSYLIIQGGAKAYYLRQGKAICIWFAFENEAVGTLETFQELTSKETVELLEDTTLLQFPLQQLKSLASKELSASHMLNDLLIEHAMYTEDKLRQLLFMTAQERYAALLEKTPSVLQRVSLTDIASYLGVSRETLSRIRGMK